LNSSIAHQQLTDSEILERLAEGKPHEAFDRLVDRYSQKVFHLAFSMLRNETQAEDMTQEILLRVWKGLSGFHGEAALSTWIYAISRNTCLTELKKRAAHPTISLQEPGFEETAQSFTALQTTGPTGGIEMDVDHMLNQLQEKYRQVITLFYLEQKSYEDISQLLDVPLGTVKTFLYRAKKELLKIGQRRVPALA
jgi:RNA polymerase sigma-70 factor, ECF subfamily